VLLLCFYCSSLIARIFPIFVSQEGYPLSIGFMDFCIDVLQKVVVYLISFIKYIFQSFLRLFKCLFVNCCSFFVVPEDIELLRPFRYKTASEVATSLISVAVFVQPCIRFFAPLFLPTPLSVQPARSFLFFCDLLLAFYNDENDHHDLNVAYFTYKSYFLPPFFTSFDIQFFFVYSPIQRGQILTAYYDELLFCHEVSFFNALVKFYRTHHYTFNNTHTPLLLALSSSNSFYFSNNPVFDPLSCADVGILVTRRNDGSSSFTIALAQTP
jgi:hypothetical protein